MSAANSSSTVLAPMPSPAPRILLVGFHTPLNQAAVLRALEQEGSASFVALISRSNFLGEKANVFIDSSTGYRNLGFTVSHGWPFPSRELWERLRPSEVVAMQMMDRVHRISGARNRLESRKRRWLEWVAYAHGFLRHHGIDRVVHCNVPHFPFEYILHEVARALGLETHFLMQLPVKKTFLVTDSITGIYKPLMVELERLGSNSPPALEPRMQAELERRTTRHEPFYMHSRGVPLWTRLHSWQRRLFRIKLRAIPTALAYWRARRASARRSSADAPYVYFPMHLQPEATTLPLGGVYEDQILVVDSLARALPEGWQIVVKENPKQRFDKRDASLYHRLRSLPAVRLVARDADSFDLLEGSKAVAAITGTAGWEALCAGKPVLTFGNAFYRHAEGSTPVDGSGALSRALEQLAAGDLATPSPEGCARLLAALQAVSYCGMSDSVYLRDTNAEDLENAVRTCTAAVAEVLGQIKASPPRPKGAVST
ncbi:MAG TPA: hypothetical protein EYG54_00245 [Myxococcales bacterium]|nr:hypothetical protein [Myxococcales bacterium]